MKKKLFTLMMVIVMVVMTACGEEEVVFGISQAAGDLLDSEAFTDTLTKCDDDKALSLYGLESSVLAEYEVYIGTGATAEEIAIFRVKDSGDVSAVEAACEARVTDQKAACENYLPDEISKLDSAVLRSSGNYVVLCISNDNDKINTVLDGYLK